MDRVEPTGEPQTVGPQKFASPGIFEPVAFIGFPSSAHEGCTVDEA